jgi:hypothetical protein
MILIERPIVSFPRKRESRGNKELRCALDPRNHEGDAANMERLG